MAPNPTSGSPNKEFSDHILISPIIESSNISPNIIPLIEAITILGNSSIFLKMSFPFLFNSSASFLENFLILSISSSMKDCFSPLIDIINE